jgi:hypothetical protein
MSVWMILILLMTQFEYMVDVVVVVAVVFVDDDDDIADDNALNVLRHNKFKQFIH